MTTLLSPHRHASHAAKLFDVATWHHLFVAGFDAGRVPWSVSDGSTISPWPDISGNGRDVSQGTAGARPTADDDLAAYGLKFVGTWDGGDSLTGSAFTAVAQPYTIVLVGGLTNASNNRGLIDVGGVYIRRESSNTRWELFGGSGTLSGANGGADLNPHLFVAVLDGASSSLEVDGTQVASGNGGSTSATITRLGHINGLQPLIGSIAVAGLIPGAISATQRAAIENIAAEAYGLSIS